MLALFGERQLDINEDIEVVLIPVAEVGKPVQRIVKGKICVYGTFAAIIWG